MNNFKLECKKQTLYICTSCHRLLWKKSVQMFTIENYHDINTKIRNLVLDENYRIYSVNSSIYICHNCHRTLKSGRVPAQSKANGMDLEQVPDELKDLNNMEVHTICKRILFMKLVKLPRGKQKGIKGAAVNVPADLGPTCNLLPRIPADAHIISLKLKRKLEYKHAYLHDTIQPEKVLIALQYLKTHNPLYADIEINENWIQTWQEDEQQYDGIFNIDQNNTDSALRNHDDTDEGRTSQISHNGEIFSGNCSDSDDSDSAKMEKHASDDDEKEDRIALEENCKLQDLPCDSCLQSEIPEQANQIFLIAPGEGKQTNTTAN